MFGMKTRSQRRQFGIPVVKSGDWYASRDNRIWYEIAPTEGGPMVSVRQPGVPSLSGLGAMGWSDMYAPWMLTAAASRRYQSGECSGTTSRAICAMTPRDVGQMAAWGCVRRGRACMTRDGNSGNVYCCPSEMSARAPMQAEADTLTGKGLTPSGETVYTGNVTTGSGSSGAHITSLQQMAQAVGCNPGTIDGVWGPNTQRGAQCYVQQVGQAAAYTRFPFLASLMGGGTAVATGGGGRRTVTPTTTGGGGTTEPRYNQASILSTVFDPRSPWLWLSIVGIAVGGFAIVRISKRSDESDESEEDAWDRKLPEAEAEKEYQEEQDAKAVARHEARVKAEKKSKPKPKSKAKSKRKKNR